MDVFLALLINSVHSVNWLLRDAVAAFAIACETTIGVGLVVPGETMVVVAATGVKSLPDYLGLYAFVLLGSLAGESLGFWLGRAFGARIRGSALGRRIGEKNWVIADAFVESRGGLAVALSRFLPVLHSVVPVTVGMSRLTYRVFIRWTMAACAIWALAYTAVGWVLHSTYELWLGRLKFGGLIFVGVVVLVFVAISLVKKRVERAAESMIVAGETEVAISETESQEGLQ